MLEISLGNRLKILRQKNKFPEIILETPSWGKHFAPAYGFDPVVLFKVNNGNTGADLTHWFGFSFSTLNQ